MLEILLVAATWALFLGSHILLATPPLRDRAVARLGAEGFVVAYSAIAMVLFSIAVVTFASVRQSGPPGPALGAISWLRVLLTGAIALGLSLMIGSFAPRAYVESPYLSLAGAAREPRGLERITRHPFFTGLVLFMAAHVLLATHLTGSIFALGFVVLSVWGSRLQDRKLRRSRPGFDAFEGATSSLPFVAILGARQRLVLAELPWLWLLAGAGAAIPLRAVHDRIFADHGLWFLLPFYVGPAIFVGIAIRRSRREAARR